MHLVLIDGSGFIFRAFHALPPMTRPDGTPVNAVFGFTNMLARLLKDHVGTHHRGDFRRRPATRSATGCTTPTRRTARRARGTDPAIRLVREATEAFGVPRSNWTTGRPTT
jgi:DNA polymerase-1